MSQRNYTQFYPKRQLQKAALFWLDRGVNLLPVQPDTKYLVRGFGLHRRCISTIEGARRFFGNGRISANLAVCGAGLHILDFDDKNLYKKWIQNVGGFGKTYSEKTRRGYHVFFSGPSDLPRLSLVDGVELVKLVVVAPSTVDGFTYEAVDAGAPILDLGEIEKTILFPLSEKKVIPDDAPKVGPASSGDDLISRIKRAVPIHDLAASLTKLKRSGGDGRWYVGLCPFHDDHNPSFWIDTQTDLWGCHAGCGRGDVINLYSRAHDLTIQEAIKALAGEVQS